MGIENKVEEHLSAVKEQDSLDKTIRESNALEIAANKSYFSEISSFLEGAIVGGATISSVWTLMVNFRLPLHIQYVGDKKVRDSISPLGFLVGGIASVPFYAACETAVLLAACHYFGGFGGLLAYAGQKALTNTVGYFYYKRQRQKHYLLEKYCKPLIEEK